MASPGTGQGTAAAARPTLTAASAKTFSSRSSCLLLLMRSSHAPRRGARGAMTTAKATAVLKQQRAAVASKRRLCLGAAQHITPALASADLTCIAARWGNRCSSVATRRLPPGKSSSGHSPRPPPPRPNDDGFTPAAAAAFCAGGRCGGGAIAIVDRRRGASLFLPLMKPGVTEPGCCRRCRGQGGDSSNAALMSTPPLLPARADPPAAPATTRATDLLVPEPAQMTTALLQHVWRQPSRPRL